MKALGTSLVWAITAVVVVGCSGSEPSTGTGEGEVTTSEAAFAYECTTEQQFISAATTKVVVSKKHLQLTDDYGEQTGWIDASAKARKGYVAYDGFETGMDCSLSITSESGLADGKPGKVHIDCSGDDMISEDLDCSNPKAAKIKIEHADPPPPVDPTTVIPESAKSWECKTTDGSPFSDKVTMKVVDGAIRVTDTDDAIDYTGTRDRDYHPHSGTWIQFDDVEYGGDCSIKLVVGGEVLSQTASSTTLKVRCSGDDFLEARYSCKKL